MKTHNTNTSNYFPIAAAAILSGLLSFNVGATETSIPGKDAALIYQSKSANPSIYSYLNSVPGKVSAKPELVYVSRAYGPAIHSYAHVGAEMVVPWNVEYVDTAYGQAIYSYDNNNHSEGVVDVLPLEIK
ncbi:hypothetical protein [Methylomonas methanica]|uniref:Uncharacterized protein n=1 Tax=Methylomonas methanica (strain DSM 25384 / MC09) TaxID=857087 RepID=F9ZZY1_METMM|nr:hypothetical protein [Methylomonas methanica]AEF99949.1 hypothetical protein Metme_1528 [Methylomonas methanica MC09]